MQCWHLKIFNFKMKTAKIIKHERVFLIFFKSVNFIWCNAVLEWQILFIANFMWKSEQLAEAIIWVEVWESASALSFVLLPICAFLLLLFYFLLLLSIWQFRLFFLELLLIFFFRLNLNFHLLFLLLSFFLL